MFVKAMKAQLSYLFQERMGFGTFPSSYLVANCQGEERLQDPFPTSQDLSAPSTCWQQGAGLMWKDSNTHIFKHF